MESGKTYINNASNFSHKALVNWCSIKLNLLFLCCFPDNTSDARLLEVKRIKDVRAKIFYKTDFFKLMLQSDIELLMSEMQKKLGVT